MRVNDIDLRLLLKFQPETGRLLIGEERFLLFRQDAFGTLRKLLFEQLGPALAPSLLAQFGYRCGTGDYSSMTDNTQWDTEMDKLAAGPTMHCCRPECARVQPSDRPLLHARNVAELV